MGTSRHNLRPFQKGRSGNPGGRPKGTSLTATLRGLLTDETRDALARELLELAQNAARPEVKLAAIREVFDRVDGKAVARNENGEPGTYTGLEDVPTSELLKMLKRTDKGA